MEAGPLCAARLWVHAVGGVTGCYVLNTFEKQRMQCTPRSPGRRAHPTYSLHIPHPPIQRTALFGSALVFVSCARCYIARVSSAHRASCWGVWAWAAAAAADWAGGYGNQASCGLWGAGVHLCWYSAPTKLEKGISLNFESKEKEREQEQKKSCGMWHMEHFRDES